ncbi:hypothetical protein BX616_010909 [Lobosporangium transversale]|uniref:ATP-NAD kinase-like domain-containing protein n=1 Tax=Lobosporangium transversale TaxID=64571 RepID=A0A1Y2GEQ1_9FUNG|nr:ATP-NAD kinase-like domain-containing protein [Lobosporangium transversale]KAF9917903.1 hypothetical protein BX616_010909 [Lobosporangium transversale]ORZ07316.1 ATP-NAD kinase-like domain-containing protein [Lobosporangium transversale]|eukprot:XP_021877979.1 ATP-NAD kinase-like domain-containing protein [Lobosporangium transversale]
MGILFTYDKFPLLVVFNPFAGRKQGQDQFNKVVRPALDQSSTTFYLIETTHHGHAQSYFKENIQQILIELAQSFGIRSTHTGGSEEVHATSSAVHSSSATLRIMVLGGDGTVHEIVNGILTGLVESPLITDVFRPKVVLSVVPTGTGNAIATSLNITTVQTAVDRFLAGNSTPLRVIQVSKQAHEAVKTDSANNNNGHLLSSVPPRWEPHVYTVVVNSFGLHCATVHDADGFRFLGNERFKVATLKNIVILKQYRARVDFYGPVQRYDRSSKEFSSATHVNSRVVSTEPSLTLSGPFTYLMFTKQGSLETGFQPTPLARTSDEWLDVLAVQNVGRTQILKILGAAAKEGKHIEMEKVEYYKVKAVEFESSGVGRLCVDGEFLNVQAGPQGRMRFEVVSDLNIQLFYVYN